MKTHPSTVLSMLLLALVTVPVLPENASTPKWEIAFDFAASLTQPEVENPNGAGATSVTIGGEPRTALSQHPDATGKPLVHVTFRQVALPALRSGERLALRFAIAIREGFSRQQNPQADGCAFLVQIGGKEAFRQEYALQRWSEQRLDLNSYAGQKIDITFLTDPLQNSAFDWAVWGHPRIEIEGRKAKVKEIPRIPFLKLSTLQTHPSPSRIVKTHSDGASSTVIAVMDRHLDLAAQLQDMAPRYGNHAVPAAPELVVGEGEAPQNHTIVKILNRFGIADVQFLAYPLTVRGGVAVHAGSFPGIGRGIVTAPLASVQTREIRLFNTAGGLLKTFVPDKHLTPPYVLTIGDFLPQHKGDEIAVVGRRYSERNQHLLLYDASGTLLKTLFLTPRSEDKLTLSTKHLTTGDHLIIGFQQARKAYLMDPITRAAEMRSLPPLSNATGLYETAFASDALLVTGWEPMFSTITRINAKGDSESLNVGERENRFWAAWYGEGWESVPDGRYMRKALFRHIRTDGASPGTANPETTAPDVWAGTEFLKQYASLLKDYDTAMPAVWEPCFSHRWHKGRFQKWRDAKDPATGLPKYVSLTRNNRPEEYGEFGNIDFYAGSYACDVPALDNLYVLPLRAFLHQLAVPFRRNPERIVCLEPNHEHEIAVEADGTMGDYNPRMIEGFYRYLTGIYGPNLSALNRTLGTTFKDYFDAPRQWERGDWDAYSRKNPFYNEWLSYNRYVVNRRISETFREALLAGFPPEIIKAHQIPDTYAIGNLDAFSTVTSRFTPIDYALNAGTGYGFTRYGVWYNKPHDALQDANAAGFDMMSLGEYQALTPDNEAAFHQLRFMVDRGAMFAHCMLWPAPHDKGFNASMDRALRRLFAEDRPKPGVTGGVGQVRAFLNKSRRFDIACIGTGPERNGLLKSLRADGSWEGSVYVVPFHSHVDVASVPLKKAGNTFTCGPLRGLDSGVQIEVTFRARTTSGTGELNFRVLRGNRALLGLSKEIRVGSKNRFYRCLMRVQLPVEDIRLQLLPNNGKSRIVMDNVVAIQHTEQTPKLTKGQFGGQRHRGGVTFDILPPMP